MSNGYSITIAVPQGSVAFSGNPLTTPANGGSTTGASAMGYQINSGTISMISFDSSSGNWSVPNLTTTDCPTINTQYVLTIYAWYPQAAGGTAMSVTQQSTFTRTA